MADLADIPGFKGKWLFRVALPDAFVRFGLSEAACGAIADLTKVGGTGRMALIPVGPPGDARQYALATHDFMKSKGYALKVIDPDGETESVQ
jgi:hypothetical protein